MCDPDDVPLAFHGKAIDAACEDDRLWFDARPDRTFRLRQPVDMEFNGRFPMDVKPGHGSYVVVAKLGPGLRARVPFSLGGRRHQLIADGLLDLDAAPDETLRELFELVGLPEVVKLLGAPPDR